MGVNAEARVEQDESTEGEVYSKPTGDRTFQKFVNRLDRAPEQILRYSPFSLPFLCPLSPFHHSRFPIPFPQVFWGYVLGRTDDRYLRIQGETPEVLACNSSGILQNKDFPKCRACNGATDVEFQIMPGLLAQMDSDVGGPQELDWGVLNVLTCQKSCMPDGKDGGFVEEYLWRQEVSLEGLKSGE